jgi:hypothetical protein
MDIQNLSNYADILAIPFFLALVVYFYNKKNKTIFENMLFFFAISGLILDTVFTCMFLRFKQ